MRIGVTGASGFIGSVLTRMLLEKEHDVRVLVRGGKIPIQDGKLESFPGDITRLEDMLGFCQGLDQVYHVAGLVKIVPGFWEQLQQVNVQGTDNVLNACRQAGVKRLLHTSSIGSLSKPGKGGLWDEERPLAMNDRTEYNRSKARAEQLVRDATDLHRVIVHPTAVFGPEDRQPTLTGQTILDIAKGDLPVTVGGGFDFVDVRDVAEGMILAMEQGANGANYILAGGYNSLKDLTIQVCKAAEQKVPRWHMPLWSLYAMLPLVRFGAWITRKPAAYSREMIDATVGGERIRSQKIREELGWQTRSLEETVQDTLQWFKTHNYF